MKNKQEPRHLYNSAQWAWEMIGAIEDYNPLAHYIFHRIKQHEAIQTNNILHLGCGSGCIDYHLKTYFSITGIDLSENMVKSAARKNPECSYHVGDMRQIPLKGLYDAVIIPESIDYMRSFEDIQKVFSGAKKVLKKDGLLLVIIGYDPEHFPQNRTTVEQVKQGSKELTFIENNYTADPAGNSFEATFVFLVREKGRSEIIIDVHKLGLFRKSIWQDAMLKAGFSTEPITDEALESIEQKGTWLLIGKNDH